MCAEVYRRVRGSLCWFVASVLVWGLSAVGVHAQPVFSSITNAQSGDSDIVQTGCSSCSSGVGGLTTSDVLGGDCASCGGVGSMGCGSGGCSDGCCTPGQEPCDCFCDPNANCFTKVFCGFYHCVCCPDPCYEPKWVALANSAFFAEGPRPVTQMTLRYDHIWHIPFFDKAEFQAPRASRGLKKLNGVGQPQASIRDFYLINEAAVGNFSTWIALPYRQISTQPYNANAPVGFDGGSGFGDMIIGTKSLLIDCELMRVSFGFRTFLPTGNVSKLVGTGHVSLEPALLWALKCSANSYLQTELAYRIPIGGNSAGSVFHHHWSYNHMLYRCGCKKDIKLIGVLEANGYHFAGGQATDTRGNVALSDSPPLISASTVGNVLSVGPGCRFVFCDKLDFGVGSAFAITESSVGDAWLRFEFRWRF